MSEQTRSVPESGSTAAMPPDLSRRLTEAIPALRRFALSLTKDGDEAADVVQETCLRALAFWHQWRPGSDFESWLFQIARNLWIDRIRSRQSRERTAEAAQHLAAGYVDGQRAMEHRLTLGSIREILPRLPREQREILLNVAVEGLSYKDASARLSTPIGTVMSRLSRARRALNSELGGPVTTGLILALLLPLLDRKAQAQVSDLAELSGDLETPLAKGLLVAPLLPLADRDGRAAALGTWISETVGKALAAIGREMEGGIKSLQRADVAASLFFLLLVDLALLDHGGYQQLRDLLDLGADAPEASGEKALVALDESAVGQDHGTIAALESDGGRTEGRPMGGSAAQGEALAQFAPGQGLEGLQTAEVQPATDKSSEVTPEADQDKRVVEEFAPGDPLSAEPKNGQGGSTDALTALARAAETGGPFDLAAHTLALDGTELPDGGGRDALAMGKLGDDDTDLPTPQIAGPAIAFILGERVELTDGEVSVQWASVLQALLSDDGADEDLIFGEGDAALPEIEDWQVAESEETGGTPLTIGELLDQIESNPLPPELIEEAIGVQVQLAEDKEVAPPERPTQHAEADPLDPLTENAVQTDVS